MIYCNKRKKYIKPDIGQIWLSNFNDKLILLMIGKDDRLLWSQNPSKGVVKTGLDASKHPTIGYLVSELIQEAPKPKSQWQPIESAPRGFMTKFLVCSPNETPDLAESPFSNGEWDLGITPRPTHWMPLPAAPEDKP